jgi:hypothetical protein
MSIVRDAITLHNETDEFEEIGEHKILYKHVENNIFLMNTII